MGKLGTKKSGYLIIFGIDEDYDPTHKLISWNVVLKGGISRTTVYSERKDLRNLVATFNNRNKSSTFLDSSFNATHYKIFRDKVQCVHHTSFFFRAKFKQN